MKIDINTFDKDEFCNYYAEHSTNSTKKHFNLTDLPLNQLLEKYNLSKHSKSENIKFTNLEKYGCINVFQLDSLKEKAKATKLEKYGNSNYNNPDKRKDTCLEKYGTVSASGNSEIQKKIQNTCLEKYGVSNIFKNHDIVQNSWVEKYGDLQTYYSHCQKSREETFNKKYGVTNPSQIKSLKNKAEISRKNTCLERYGVESTTLLSKCRNAMGGNTSFSKPNINFANLLKNHNISFEQEFVLGNRSYDFKIGNTLIEINPTSTHNSTWSPFGDKFKKDSTYHYNKSKLATDSGYRCICVWDWDDYKKIISLLTEKEKIYARKCVIKDVSITDAKNFINTNHLQNYAKDEIRIGLYYCGELVSIMTFGKPRYNKNYEYELIRYCSSKNIVGGAKKLFSYFVKTYNPQSIISYCDLSKFSGKTYYNLGFELDKVSIGKHWYNQKTEQHITDNLLRQHGFDQLFNVNYGKGTSNKELMLQNGFVEVFDCGQAKFIKNFEKN